MKNEFGYKETIEITEKALDILDIKKFLIKDKDPHEIMNDIDDYIEDGDGEDVWKVEYFMKEYPEIFGDPWFSIFNYMDDDEFITYCKKRYPEIHWGHEFIERYWVAT